MPLWDAFTGLARNTRRAVILLLLLSIVQYAYSLCNDFVWDAETALLSDPSIREWRNLPGFFLEDSHLHLPRESGREHYAAYYRPVMKIVHLVEYSVFGTHPAGYHAVNIALNALVVVLAFLLVSAATGRPDIALGAALLYAVNPTRVEAVSWAYSDSYVFSGCFILLSLLCFQRRRIAAAALLYSMALLTHEAAVVFPAVVALYAGLIQRGMVRDVLRRTAPFLVLVLIYLAVRSAVVGPAPLSKVGPATYVLTSAVIMKRLVKMFFIPDAPVTLYTNELFSSIGPEVAISLGAAAMIIALGAVLWQRDRPAAFWYLWFFAWIGVAFNIGAFGAYSIAEKFLYLASLGFCVLLARLAADPPRYGQAVRSLLFLLIIVHSLLTFSRLPYWRTTVDLLEAALDFAPQAYIGQYTLGNGYLHRGQIDTAIERYERALLVRPDFGFALANLGSAYYEKGDRNRALAYWEQATRADPLNAVPFFNIALLMEEQGRIEQALPPYRRYLALTASVPPGERQHIDSLDRMLAR